MHKGIFITLEGIDGVGKTTHANLVADFFRQKGKDVVLTREPGGTKIGESIRNLLLIKDDEELCPDTELLLMFAARAQHLLEVIKPAFKENKLVICDRFIDASYAYQGGGRGISPSRINVLENLIVPDLTPDLTVLLDAPIEIALERAGQRDSGDRFEAETSHFFQSIRDAYLKLAESKSGRISVVDASRDIDTVQNDIVKLLENKKLC